MALALIAVRLRDVSVTKESVSVSAALRLVVVVGVQYVYVCDNKCASILILNCRSALCLFEALLVCARVRANVRVCGAPIHIRLSQET